MQGLYHQQYFLHTLRDMSAQRPEPRNQKPQPRYAQTGRLLKGLPLKDSLVG